jgi:hypothetical protein
MQILAAVEAPMSEGQILGVLGVIVVIAFFVWMLGYDLDRKRR